MRKNSVKNRRINDEVRKALAAIVRDVKDPRISPLTSITGTEVAPDLKTCKVYVSVYGDSEAGTRTMEGLKSASRFIRGELARKVNLRNTPELTFVLDDSIAYGVAMSHRIDEVTAADRNAELARGQETDESIQDE
jgi:ribosome-binding factor A